MTAALQCIPPFDPFCDRPDVRIEGCASEPSPVYPAIFASALFDARDVCFASVHVFAQPTQRALFDSVERGRCICAAKKHTLYSWSATDAVNPLPVDHAQGVWLYTHRRPARPRLQQRGAADEREHRARPPRRSSTQCTRR
jgi:hypothetical protein